MIEYNYNKGVNLSLTKIPDDLIRMCKENENYNISALAGLLFYIPQLERAKTILEIGTGRCVSTIALASAAKINDGKVISFDIHNRAHVLAKYPDLLPYIIPIKETSISCSNSYEVSKLVSNPS